jgi:hypothetical protein
VFQPDGLELELPALQFLSFAQVGEDYVGCFEVPRLVAREFGLLEDTRRPTHAWTPGATAKFEALVEAMNARLDGGAGFEFAIPTAERWRAMVERAQLVEELTLPALFENTPWEQEEIGVFDPPPRTPPPDPQQQSVAALTHRSGLYGLLGGVWETSLNGPENAVVLLGSSEYERQLEALDEGDLTPALRPFELPPSEWVGVRLFLNRIDP